MGRSVPEIILTSHTPCKVNMVSCDVPINIPASERYKSKEINCNSPELNSSITLESAREGRNAQQKA